MSPKLTYNDLKLASTAVASVDDLDVLGAEPCLQLGLEVVAGVAAHNSETLVGRLGLGVLRT